MRNKFGKGNEGKSNDGRGSSGLQRHTAIDQRYCITVPEAAARLGLSRNFTYELVKHGQLRVIRFGKRLFIPRLALEKLLEKE